MLQHLETELLVPRPHLRWFFLHVCIFSTIQPLKIHIHSKPRRNDSCRSIDFFRIQVIFYSLVFAWQYTKPSFPRLALEHVSEQIQPFHVNWSSFPRPTKFNLLTHHCVFSSLPLYLGDKCCTTQSEQNYPYDVSSLLPFLLYYIQYDISRLCTDYYLLI